MKAIAKLKANEEKKRLESEVRLKPLNTLSDNLEFVSKRLSCMVFDGPFSWPL